MITKRIDKRLYKNYTIIVAVIGDPVEVDPKPPFSITTTPRCKGGRYSIPWIAPLYP